MSTPGQGSILGSSIIYGKVDFGPTFGNVYRPLNQKRVVTAAGNDVIQPFDVYVFYNKIIPAIFSVQLPDLNVWMNSPVGGFDLVCKDSAQNSFAFPINFIPFGASQTIDGQNVAQLPNGAYQLASNGGTLIFSPLVDKSGWSVL